MNDFLARVRVFFRSAPTYLVAAATIVTILTEEISEELSGDLAAGVLKVGGKVVAVIGAAVAIIRRSTPVLPEERGMLMPPKPANPEDPAFDELAPRDNGQVSAELVLLVLICVGVGLCLAKLY